MSAERSGPAFGERLIARVAERESQFVLGVDPDPRELWPVAREAVDSLVGRDARATPARRAAAAVEAHCRALIDATAPACVAVKLQLACFERLGAPGWDVLASLCEHARGHGLLVIADGKRGDIAVTAAAYAQGLLDGPETPWGRLPGLGADMLTANPLLGADALQPLVAGARDRGACVLALVRTSNPGAADIQELELAAGGALWERLAALVHELGRHDPAGAGPADALADVGAVLGATAPGVLARARELMPGAVFLLPGIGAQGARIEQLGAALAPLQGAARRASALFTAARSVAGAHSVGGSEPAEAARAEAERLRADAWQLG